MSRSEANESLNSVTFFSFQGKFLSHPRAYFPTLGYIHSSDCSRAFKPMWLHFLLLMSSQWPFKFRKCSPATHLHSMQNTEIVAFSVFVSMATLYMRVAPDIHIRNFEEISASCRVILETLGRADYLKASPISGVPQWTPLWSLNKCYGPRALQRHRPVWSRLNLAQCQQLFLQLSCRICRWSIGAWQPSVISTRGSARNMM